VAEVRGVELEDARDFLGLEVRDSGGGRWEGVAYFAVG
jgi:hypothetical protein